MYNVLKKGELFMNEKSIVTEAIFFIALPTNDWQMKEISDHINLVQTLYGKMESFVGVQIETDINEYQVLIMSKEIMTEEILDKKIQEIKEELKREENYF